MGHAFKVQTLSGAELYMRIILGSMRIGIYVYLWLHRYIYNYTYAYNAAISALDGVGGECPKRWGSGWCVVGYNIHRHPEVEQEEGASDESCYNLIVTHYNKCKYTALPVELRKTHDPLCSKRTEVHPCTPRCHCWQMMFLFARLR